MISKIVSTDNSMTYYYYHYDNDNVRLIFDLTFEVSQIKVIVD